MGVTAEELFKTLDTRLDYILIWGHGLPYENEIIEEIRSQFSIVRFHRHKPKNIKKFISTVYNFDYAPLHHLKAKTKYLNKVPAEVLIVIIENSRPEEAWYGEGDFRHLESERIKAFKDKIRDKYNPKLDDGCRSENHVIHASDNPYQVKDLLENLYGVETVTAMFSQPSRSISTPWHVHPSTSWSMRLVNVESIKANIATGQRWKFKVKRTPIKDTPHYKALTGEPEKYSKYLETFRGTALCDNYNLDTFLNGFNGLNYPSAQYGTPFIVAIEQDNGEVLIVDGVHRCAHLIKQGQTNILMGVFKAS